MKRFSHWRVTLDITSGTSLHGSYNFNTKSSKTYQEAVVLIKNTELANQVEEQLKYDLLGSQNYLFSSAFLEADTGSTNAIPEDLSRDYV